MLDLHFCVHSFNRKSFHADATLEIPIDEGYTYFSITAGGSTQAQALLQVIQKIETSSWFHYMKSRHVYFRVTGSEMEQLYHGYL